ncbi:type II toxin-antitoxin system RelE/ParE family toxin [Nitrincola iocasae]|uniref:Type II toxin-antitoxin system RelE/ParE family toxin n=1 Tax=Nitrincola iocasae TaxID=2614693 RepID=A0A5J6LB16_9GAMM|nr:type II toxin-antitoxin system RelE/ParE family toxin [Nitrincola iocasae]QEW05844.1 type II toxin-antitoxin system RelE/ParE family toxin [Nitrincola iocasae]
MSVEPNETGINVYESPVFKKTLSKLPEDDLVIIEDAVDVIIENPEIGQLKKGDLSYLRVHKFSLNGQQVLLGYNWQEEQLTLYLLNIGPHENFYTNAKKHRKADLKFIK